MYQRLINKIKRETNGFLSKLFEGKISQSVIETSYMSNTKATDYYSFTKGKFSYIGKKPYWMDFENIPLRAFGIKSLKNVEVINRGVIINEEGHIELESTIFQREYLNRLNCNHWIFLRKLFPSTEIEKAIVLSNYLDNNYYHWILESIGRLALIDSKKLKDYKIVIDSNPPKFVIESLTSLFNINTDSILKKNCMRLNVSDVLIPTFPHTRDENNNWTNIYNSNVIEKTNALSKEKTSLTETRHNLIISRRKATQRRILNTDILFEKFSQLNFELVYLEDLTFKEQMQLFRNAGVVIAPHGAGLTNLIFSENPFVVELFPSNRNNRDAFYFYQISNTLNFHHYIVECETNNDKQDLLIDEHILNTLNNIITKHNATYTNWTNCEVDD